MQTPRGTNRVPLARNSVDWSDGIRKSTASENEQALASSGADDDKNSKALLSKNKVIMYSVVILVSCLAVSVLLALIYYSKRTNVIDLTHVDSKLSEPLRTIHASSNFLVQKSVPVVKKDSIKPDKYRKNEKVDDTKEPPQSTLRTNQVRTEQLLDRSVTTAPTNNDSKYALPAGITWKGCLSSIPGPEHLYRKHMVPPPPGPATLVCCDTTKGVLNIQVHRTWAPYGAERFLHMVKSGFFKTKVGLFRALRNFLVQFGLPGDPTVLKYYRSLGNLPDDKPWLPLGPSGREINGTLRFQQGYLAYAGAGKNSRGTQLIMSFKDNAFLAGGSPWEVPWGQLFGKESFITLGKIYTGYGEKPSQGKIMNQGNKYLEQEFPELDYITDCAIVKENVSWRYEHPFQT